MMTTSTTDLLATMTEKAAAIPGVAYKQPSAAGHNDRAESAADLVATGKVQFVGEQNGDHWLVNGHRCSIARKSCDCYDHSAPPHNGGRLCKHRLAAMFQKRISEAQFRTLDGIFEEAQGDGITLRMDVYYKAAGRDYKITAIRTSGGRWQSLGSAPADRIDITDREFEKLIARHGREIAGNPHKSGWLGYEYTLRPIEHGEARPHIALNAAASETTDRKRRNATFAAMQGEQWAAADRERVAA